MLRISRIALLLVPLFASTLLVGCDTEEGTSGESTTVTVMTRNLYLGGDLFVLLQAKDASEVPGLVYQLYYGSVVLSDVPARMDAVAAEIQAASPDIVGLQEVSTYFTQSPADNLPGGAGTTATNVSIDFLQLLLDALAARGQNYTVAAVNENADVELPATNNGTTFTDIRLLDRDVILVKEGTTLTNTVDGEFAINAEIPIGGTPVEFTRGFSYGTAMKDGVRFTFANAHLEVGGPAVQAQIAQANQLAATLVPATTPVILVGDFNSNPADSGADGNAYRLLTDTYTDAGAVLSGGNLPTCCQAADLRNPTSELSTRIDLILYRGDAEAISINVVGDDPGDRTDLGLWPSDHAGVVASLVVRN